MRLVAMRLVVFVALACTSSLYAEPVPPLTAGSDVAPRATLAHKRVDGLTLGPLYVRFEDTRLDEIRAAMGNGSIEHQGDAGESVYWLCYTLRHKDSTVRLWLISHGEMGGPDHTVTVIQAAKMPVGPVPEGCPVPMTAVNALRFDHGIWLGTSAAYLKSRLGVPSVKRADRWYYSYAGKSPGVHGGAQVEYDVLSVLEARLSRGHITTIIASQTTSY